MTTNDCPIVQRMEAEYYLHDQQALIELRDHQRRILNVVFTPRADGQLPYRTAVISAPKKSGKTAIGGSITYAFLREYGGSAYSIANDAKQAETRMFERVAQSLALLEEHQPRVFAEAVETTPKGGLIHNGDEIRFRGTHQQNPDPHKLVFIPGDYAGEAGGMPALTVWDELWAYKLENHFRLYEEMQPIPIIAQSMRLITTYAGWYGESKLLHSLYETVCKPDPHNQDVYHGERVPGLEDLPCYHHPESRTFVYWDHVARMPLHTPQFLQEAKNDPAVQGRQSEYYRLWENRWTTGLESFIPVETIQALMDKGKARGLVNHMEGLV